MNNKLYIGNLDYSVLNSELQSFLAEKWQVTECKVIEGKGFAFVTFANDQVANEAKAALDGYEFKGRKLRIDFARESTGSSGGRSRSGGGGYGGGGYGGGGGYNKKRY